MKRFARVEPIGIEHGTVLILEGGLRVECTTFRREGAYSDARRPDHVDVHATTRSRTWRAATSPSTRWRSTPTRASCSTRTAARSTSSAACCARSAIRVARFREDALRPLRVARFAATLEMEPEPAHAPGARRGARIAPRRGGGARARRSSTG